MKFLITTILLLYISICFSQYNYGLEVENLDARIEGKLNLGYGNVSSSVIIGSGAGVNAPTNSSGNTLIGFNAGSSITTSNSNTLIGQNSGTHITSGNGNTCLGSFSCSSLRQGSFNLFLGRSSGVFVKNGNDNIMIGNGSGNLNDTGNENVIIGSYAGSSLIDAINPTGSNNVFIGSYAGNFLDLDESNKLIIESENGSTEPLIYGEFDNNVVQINGTLHISEIAKLKPTPQPSMCNTADEVGLIYFDSNTDKLTVCTLNSGWQALNQ